MWKPTRREAIYLFILLITAYIIRGIPSWFNWAWGNDFGIYYGLSSALVDNPQLFKPYTGWGQSYHYFPMLYIIMAGLHHLTGIEVNILLRVVSPIIGSLSVIVFYFAVKQFKTNEYIPYLAGFLLALNPFHAYQTAHAAPLTVAHLFMMLSLLFFLKKDDKPWATHALYIATILLIMSHHLTTFVYIVIIIGISFFRAMNSKTRPRSYWTDISYIVFLTILTFAYWAYIATPVFYRYMPGGLYLTPIALVALFYVLMVVIIIIIELKYRHKFEYRPKLFTSNTEIFLAALVFLILIAFVGVFSFTDLGTGFSFLPIALILLLPTAFIFSLSVIALNRVDFEPYGPEVKGLFYPVFGILIFSIITWNNVLLPFRFFEYIAYPISILSAIGFFYLIKLKGDETWNKITVRTKGIIAVFLVIILISGATTYPIQRTTSGFEESISDQVQEGIVWLELNGQRNLTVASDHRISNVLWERGFNATYDYAYNLWFSPTWNSTDCLSELEGHGIGKEYGRVGYILIDSVMVRDGVQSNINETPRVMTGRSYEKFNHQPFELFFQSESLDIFSNNELLFGPNNEELYPYTNSLTRPLPMGRDWCRVYQVNWTYIAQEEYTNN
jgi:hypothetical protein